MVSPNEARIHSFKVIPALPEPLKPLMDIARNMWWAWHPDAVDLFIRIDRSLWQKTKHNPVLMLGQVPQPRLEEMAQDDGYIASVQRVHEWMQIHLSRKTWFERAYPNEDDFTVAYFCAEFGLTESFQIYSGGLGILAGDHLKSASELGVPLVGVGLLYRKGYFQQYLNADGWQQESYPDLDFANLPLKRMEDENGEPITVGVDLPGRHVRIAVWQANVGRVRLMLLDTNLADNEPADRAITAQLYGGDMDMRIRQELVLGIGGWRALNALGIKPSVVHLNEGHAAFVALERIREMIEQRNLSFDEARWAGAGGNVFTTHTPVPAGIDRFPTDMIHRYFKDYIAGLRLDMEGLLALGRENVFNKNEFFSMAVLALRTSDAANGVSKLHGEVSRDMWRNIWPGVPKQEVPIGHVTNGVHARSWISAELIRLYDRYLGLRWQNDPADYSVWEALDEIPDEELWRVHQSRKQRLVSWVRRTLHQQLTRRGASGSEIEAGSQAFDYDVLTIGFARRFATYKRANMLFRDMQRITRLLTDPEQPLQIIVAGKAHPADTQGKELIRQIVHFARAEGLKRRVVFIENYDMHVARYMVQGCDIWLNTPRRGMEASGTSGMKAAINGVLNCSILDGWWDEAYENDIGWAIGAGETYANYDYQDQVESQALYDLLEKRIIPLYYERTDEGWPRRWVERMKRCMKRLSPAFNSNRMVQQYIDNYYVPAHRRQLHLNRDDLANAKKLNEYKQRLRHNWNKIAVEEVKTDASQVFGVNEPVKIEATLQLGDLSPEDVKVQAFYGQLDAEGNICGANAQDLEPQETTDGKQVYRGEITVDNSGEFGFSIRIIPGHPELATPFEPGLIIWDQGSKHSDMQAEPAAVAG